MSKAELPRGTVTCLFTDIEGSTSLLQRLGNQRYVQSLEAHRRLIRNALRTHRGVEVEMQGDSFHFAFASARDAVLAAASAQQALASHEWESEPIHVRIGLHTGEPIVAEGLYAGLDVHRAARVMGAGHGGQILLSERTADLVHAELPEELRLHDLGLHRLKDLSAPQRLYQLVVPGLRHDFPPPTALSGRRTNLPIQPNRIIGRVAELAEITRRIRTPETQLLTLVGAGGSGKTKLALHAAAELVDAFTDGVMFVPLAPVRDPSLVIPTVAQTLGVHEQPDLPIAATLFEYLAGRHVLLLLDNFEHVVDAAPELSKQLAGSRGLHVLVTSREPLRVSGEQVYTVLPLPTPDDDGAIAADRALANDAIALFVERAAASTPDFRLTEENVAAVGAICTRLDGLPLAIELAAGRTNVLSPAAIFRRLDSSLNLLTSGGRDLDERQRTLRNTINWSYELLTPDEQRLFAQMSVFVGGCRVEAAEAVCSNDDGARPVDVFGGLCSLVEKNLLRRRDDADGEPRFWMLETIRDHAAERLADLDERTEVERRHAAWFCQFAAAAEKRLHAPDQSVVLSILRADLGNLRAALDWLTAAGEQEEALTLASALGGFAEIRGGWTEVSERLEELLERGAAQPSVARARALLTAGKIAFYRGDAPAARTKLKEAVDQSRFLRDDELLALSLGMSAFALAELGEYAQAKTAGEEGVEVARRTRNSRVLAEALNDLTAADFYDPDGDHRRARAASEEALGLWREVGDVHNEIESLNNLGYIDLVEGRFAQARASLEEAADLAHGVEDLRHVVLVADNLALVSLFLGEYELARSQLFENLKLCREIGDYRVGREALLALGAVEAASGEYDRAVRLFGAARVSSTSPTLPPAEQAILDQFLPSVRSALGDEAFSRAWQESSRLAFSEALGYALGDEDHNAAPSVRAAAL